MMAAEQDEGNEENFVRKHICSDAEVLKAKGKEETEAWRIASYRIFGNAPGTYGAGRSEEHTLNSSHRLESRMPSSA